MRSPPAEEVDGGEQSASTEEEEQSASTEEEEQSASTEEGEQSASTEEEVEEEEVAAVAGTAAAAMFSCSATAGREVGSRRASMTRRRAGSTTSWWAAKKSLPKIGRETAANKNLNLKILPPKQTDRVEVDQEGIGRPLAPSKAGPEAGEGDQWGSRLREAPVSTRKTFPVKLSRR